MATILRGGVSLAENLVLKNGSKVSKRKYITGTVPAIETAYENPFKPVR